MSDRSGVIQAPSNIAILKYMGKSDPIQNLAINPSVSLTLNALATWVEWNLELGKPLSFQLREWPEMGAGVVSDAARTRMAAFFDKALPELQSLLVRFGFSWQVGAIDLRTANTFPSGAGIASSASSFAAVTLAIAQGFSGDPEAFARRFHVDLGFREALARISRKGSGSSCRSFFPGWVEWDGEHVRTLESKIPQVTDLVLLVDSETKLVSSSEAHKRVLSSALFEGRPDRVKTRLDRVRQILVDADWAALREVVWADSMEMHSLFHTSQPPFSYWKDKTLNLLHLFLAEGQRVQGRESPLVTMDAGPNLHVLVPTEDSSFWKSWLADRAPELKFLEDVQGDGPKFLGRAK